MLLLLACVADPTLLLAPDPTRTGTDGADGPYGAALTTRAYTARVTETVPVDYVYPADGDAEPVDIAGGWPLVVFVHGGAVEPKRYNWLAAHLASRGYAVGLPHHPLDLAFFEAGNARVARDGLQEDEHLSGTSAVGGHSLGGVVSVIDWVADPAFTAVFLAASYPDGGTDPGERSDSPALSLAGSEDGYASVADVAAGAERFTEITYGVVDGMNHFDWVDNPTEAELAKDGVSTGTAATRAHALNVVDTFLDASLRDDADAAARLAGPYAGVELPMILLLVGVALADPDAVRVPTAGVAASVGSPGFSGVGWFGDQGVGATVGGGAISIFGAARTPVRSGWGAGLTFGFAVPWADPTLAVETSAWIGPAYHGRWFDLGADLVVPAAASPLEGVARIGARLEPRLGVHLRGVTVSVSGGAGIVESTDSGWAMDLRAAVGIGYHPE